MGASGGKGAAEMGTLTGLGSSVRRPLQLWRLGLAFRLGYSSTSPIRSRASKMSSQNLSWSRSVAA